MSPNSEATIVKPRPPGPYAPEPTPPSENFRHPRPGGKTMPYLPELERRSKVLEQSQEIGAFIDWLIHDGGFVVAEWSNRPHLCQCPECNERFYADEVPWLVRSRLSIEQLLAAYYGIDLRKVQDEQDLLLRHIREVQNL